MYEYFKLHNEEWRDVPKKFNTKHRHYMVSNLGRVMSLPDRMILEGNKVDHALWLNGLYTRIPYLVLEAFDRPRKGKEKCIYLDGDKTNNSIENLSWDFVGNRLTSKDIEQVMALHEDGWTIRQLVQKFNVHRFTIEAIINYKRRMK